MEMSDRITVETEKGLKCDKKDLEQMLPGRRKTKTKNRKAV